MSSFENRDVITLTNENQKIFGVLHIPKINNKKFPVVLMCHGFAGNKAGKYRIYVSLAESLAKAGIASLRFDFRGSGDSEGHFSDMTIQSEVSDVITNYHFLKKHAAIDSKRIGLLGNSFGGAIAILAANKIEVKSIALLAALFSTEKWKEQWQQLQKAHKEHSIKEIARAFEGNVPGPNFYKDFFELDMKSHLIPLVNVPLFHVHSEVDERISISDAYQYSKCREQASSATKFLKLSQSDHSFSNVEERLLLINELTKWFVETL